MLTISFLTTTCHLCVINFMKVLCWYLCFVVVNIGRSIVMVGDSQVHLLFSNLHPQYNIWEHSHPTYETLVHIFCYKFLLHSTHYEWLQPVFCFFLRFLSAVKSRNAVTVQRVWSICNMVCMYVWIFSLCVLSYLSIVHYPAYLRLLINFVSRNEKHILFEIIRLCLCIMHFYQTLLIKFHVRGCTNINPCIILYTL